MSDAELRTREVRVWFARHFRDKLRQALQRKNDTNCHSRLRIPIVENPFIERAQRRLLQIQIVQSRSFAKVAATDSAINLVGLVFLVLNLRINARKWGTPAALRDLVREWEKTEHDVETTIRVLTDFTWGMNKRESQDILKLIEEIKLFNGVGTSRSDPRKFVGQKAGYRAYAIRRIGDFVPEATDHRFTVIADMVKLAGFPDTKSLPELVRSTLMNGKT